MDEDDLVPLGFFSLITGEVVPLHQMDSFDGATEVSFVPFLLCSLPCTPSL